MKFDKDRLIQDLVEQTRINLNEGERFMALPLEALNKKAAEGQWSALECLEHLNRYGDFYIPEISQRIADTKIEKEAQFKSGVLGEYFAKSMKPKPKCAIFL